MGIEWFATDVISLLAEYGSELAYESSKTTSTNWHIHHIDDGDDRTSVSEEKDSGWSFDASAVKFGLSVYF